MQETDFSAEQKLWNPCNGGQVNKFGGLYLEVLVKLPDSEVVPTVRKERGDFTTKSYPFS